MTQVSPHRQAFGIAGLLVALGILGTAVLALQFDGRIDAPARPHHASPAADPHGPHRPLP